MNCDDVLLHEIIKGNIAAYEELFKKYYKLLYVSALYFLKDEDEAQDQVQQLFVEVWEKKLFLHIQVSIKAYLHKAIYNRCLKCISKKTAEEKKLKEYTLFNTIDACDGEENKYPYNKIFESLNEMPFQRKQAFHLVYIQDKKYKDAASEMGITVNSIKTHLKLAIKTLRQKFIPNK